MKSKKEEMKEKIKQSWKRFRLAWLVLLTGLGFLSFRSIEDNYFEISRNLDIFTTALRELTVYYVDPIDPEQMMNEGIYAMLESLDPYTTFIPEEEAEDYRFMTTGQYGGIGALIGQRNDEVIITDPYEGFPAQKTGLMAGDVIQSIDGKSVKGKKYDEVSRMLKGQPGTPLQIVVKREGEEQSISKSLVREEIQIKNVAYSGVVENDIGYIRLTGFTDLAGAEVKSAVEDLIRNKKVKGIILDLRGNPGGLLHEAINVTNVFVDKGQEIVSTRGKVKEWEKTYRTMNPAVDSRIPLAVLVNSGAASASEIVSGSLQDLDRAIVIGQRTFGKGLVQTTRPLNYNTQLKITTAKYYIPSGRCIQAVDYANRNPDGSVGKVPDSLIHEFKTRKGRKVYDGGGINPDYSTEVKYLSSVGQALVSNYLVFDYATQFRLKNPDIGNAVTFRLSEEQYADFVKYAMARNYEYKTETMRRLEDLKEKAQKEKYFDHIRPQYEAVLIGLSGDKQRDLDLNKSEIRELLENEIVSRYYYQKGRLEAGMNEDEDIQLAVKALHDPALYQAIFNRSYKP